MSLQRPIGFKPEEISALINEEVVARHAEEAAFLWLLRDDAVKAPNYSLKDLAGLDERVEAHLDGLRVAGKVGWKFCEEQLGREEAGEVFAAGVLAYGSGDKERIQKVLDVGCSDPELARGLISSLGWLSFKEVHPKLKELLNSVNPEVRRAAIGAFAVHREDPGDALMRAISDPDPRLRARALKAVGELGRIDLRQAALKFIHDPDEACRFFACWSATRLGSRDAPVFAVLQKITESDSRYAVRAMEMLFRCQELPKAKAWYQQLRSNPENLRLAAIGAGIIGDPEYIDYLIELTAVDEVTRVAGEAFSMITGVDLAYDDLDGDQPEDFQAGPTESPEDEDVRMDSDEDLPWPVQELVENWWREKRGSFQAGRRYICGKEISIPTLREILIKGTQRQRAAAALELAIKEPTVPLFEVRAPGKRQLERLKAWTS